MIIVKTNQTPLILEIDQSKRVEVAEYKWVKSADSVKREVKGRKHAFRIKGGVSIE